MIKNFLQVYGFLYIEFKIQNKHFEFYLQVSETVQYNM